MMVANRSSWIFAALLTLAACGGGSSFEDDGGGGGGGGTDPSDTYAIDMAVYQCDNINTDSVSGCQQTTTITETSPGLVRAVVSTETGSAANQMVTFSTDKGLLTPADGKALTNASGEAYIRILANGADGIVTLGAVVTPAVGQSAQTQEFVSINQISIALALESTLGDGELVDGATLALTARVTSDGEPLSVPATVKFSSTCASQDKALIDAEVPVNILTGTAIATYSPDGCLQQDTISAQVDLGGKSATASLTVKIATAATGGIEFSKATPDYICLDGSGCPSVSQIEFIVNDENGRPKQGVDVNFSLLTTAGGVTMSVNGARSDANGVVRTRVTAGTVPGSAVIQAAVVNTVPDAPLISTVSSTLSIGTGLPDSNSFSLSFTQLNPPHAGDTDGVKVTVTLRAADHFNNPVPNGTAISFVTEGGAIEPRCQTVNGVCSVVWTSQDPRPDDMRVNVMAFAQGEESFTDMNGNGIYDSGEFFIDANLNEVFEAGIDDVPDYAEAYTDANENGVRGNTEEYIDRNSDGLYTLADGKYNGTLCRQSSDRDAGVPNPPFAACDIIDTSTPEGIRDGLVDVYSQGTIVMTGAGAISMFICGNGDCSVAAASASSANTVRLCIFETLATRTGAIVRNPMAVGTSIAFAPDQPLEIAGSASSVQSNTNRIVHSVGAIVPDRDVFDAGCPASSTFSFAVKPGSGVVRVVVTEPSSSSVTFAVPITL